MKLRTECSVEGVVELAEPVSIDFDGLEYFFLPDEKGRLDVVAVVAAIDKPERFYSRFEHPPDGSTPKITIRMDDELIARVDAALQALESHLAFRQPVKRLRWDSAKYELVFESESERMSQSVFGIRVDRRNPVRPSKRATRVDLGKAVVATRRFAALTVPLAFLREGQNEFDEFQYISAFYNFYFVLEGLYGSGKWRNFEVQQAFASSARFQLAVSQALSEISKASVETSQLLDSELSASGTARDAAGVAQLLVRMRGRLHHFSSRGGDEPTPFSHEKYHVIAYLARAVAIFAVTEEMSEIIRREPTV